jgi:hypothetical protein
MCVHEYYYDDVNPSCCSLRKGIKVCFQEDGCGFEPDEDDVNNGYFEGKPSELKIWKWKYHGCPKCKSKDISIKTTSYDTTILKCNACNLRREIQDFDY